MKLDAAAAALIRDEGDRILILEQAYASGWTLPGGLVEVGETPREACEREIREEIGVVVSLSELMCVDWCRLPDREPIVGFLFDGGLLPAVQFARLRCRVGEIKSAEFVPVDLALGRLSTRLGQRVLAALHGASKYLEGGKQPFGV